MNGSTWVRKGLKEGFCFSAETGFRYSLIACAILLASWQITRSAGVPKLSVVDLFTLVSEDYAYRTWVLPVTAVMAALNLHLQVRRSRILYYGQTQNEWMELVGQTIAMGICCSLLMLLAIFLVGLLVSKGTLVNADDPYSLAQILLHGVPADPIVVLGRGIAAVVIQVFFVGMLITGVSWYTGKEYFGVLAALFCIIVCSGVFPSVNTSYYYFLQPDRSLLIALVKTIALWSIFVVLNRRKQWDVL